MEEEEEEIVEAEEEDIKEEEEEEEIPIIQIIVSIMGLCIPGSNVGWIPMEMIIVKCMLAPIGQGRGGSQSNN